MSKYRYMDEGELAVIMRNENESRVTGLEVLFPEQKDDLRIKITVNRPSERVEFSDFIIQMTLQTGFHVEYAIDTLREIAGRLETKCIEEPYYGHTCAHCGAVFFNYTRRKKIYCRPFCQMSAGVKRLRARRKKTSHETKSNQN